MTGNYFLRPSEPWKIEREQIDLYKSQMMYSFEIPEYRAVLPGIVSGPEWRVRNNFDRKIADKFLILFKKWKARKGTRGRVVKQIRRLIKYLFIYD